MISATARPLLPLAVLLCLGGCAHPAGTQGSPGNSPGSAAAGTIEPSSQVITGRLLAVDLQQGFAFVEVANHAPAAALIEGAELVVRTLDLRETARLRVSRYFRGKTLGTSIVSGRPSPGEEVVYPRP